MKQINRDLYLKKLIDRKENGLIKIITGIRRCGKSYLLFNLYKNYLLSAGIKEENIICLDLDDDLNAEYRTPEKLYSYLLSKIANPNEQYYILLDEAQFAISKEETKNDEPIRLYGILNGLLRRQNVDVYITGSNSKFLSSDIRTEFRGRGDVVHVNPLSFSEFYSAFDGDKSDAWREYFTFGGLPYLFACKSAEQKIQYLADVFENVYLKDIVERGNLKENNSLDSITDILASSIGSLTNPKKLADTFTSKGMKISEPTVNSYLTYLQDSFLISKAQRYDVKGKKYIDSPFKYYFTDTALRNSRLNFRQQEENHIMENIIYNELKIRGFNVDVGIVNVRTRKDGKNTFKQHEVDFVCNKGSQRYYIQSAFAIPDDEKMQQEQYSLTHIDDSFKKIIVIKDNIIPWHTEKGILVIGILDFLLDNNSLEK